MKKVISILFLLPFLGLTIFSCQKTQDAEVLNRTDTVFLKDTIYLHDTIQQLDTLFIYDSIIYNDTIVMIDTIVVHDTSEFDYLFKHYELDQYEVLFYTINKQKNPWQICRMYSDAHDIDYLAEGNKIYPIWSPDSSKILYIDFDYLAIVEQDITSNEIEILYSIDRNIMFLRYFPQEDKFLVSYKENGIKKIGAIDYHNNAFLELTDVGDEEANPTSSEVDNWLYFSRMNNGTFDIFRRKLDGSVEELVYSEPDFNLSSFSVSADGKFLITPKYFNGKGYIVFYDVERHTIIHELLLPVDGYPLYATLSRDNRAVFFVNGESYNFTEPRNIYRMGLDRTQLFQMTNFTDKLAIRPLVK